MARCGFSTNRREEQQQRYMSISLVGLQQLLDRNDMDDRAGSRIISFGGQVPKVTFQYPIAIATEDAILKTVLKLTYDTLLVGAHDKLGHSQGFKILCYLAA